MSNSKLLKEAFRRVRARYSQEMFESMRLDDLLAEIRPELDRLTAEAEPYSTTRRTLQ